MIRSTACLLPLGPPFMSSLSLLLPSFNCPLFPTAILVIGDTIHLVSSRPSIGPLTGATYQPWVGQGVLQEQCRERADLMGSAAGRTREEGSMKFKRVKAVFSETRCQGMKRTLYSGRRVHWQGGNSFLFQPCTSSFSVSCTVLHPCRLHRDFS